MSRRWVTIWQRGLLRGALSLLAAVGMADADEAGAQKAMAKAQFMLRQATAEKTTLQQQVSDLQKQVDTLTKQLADAKASAGARSDSLSKQLAMAETRARDTQEKLGGDLRASQQAIRVAEQEQSTLEQKLREQTDNFTLCHSNNRKLYDINRELLEKYNDKSAMDALLQREPFTGAAAVQIENLIQDYQYKIDDLKLPSGDAAVSAAATGTTSSMSGGGATNAP